MVANSTMRRTVPILPFQSVDGGGDVARSSLGHKVAVVLTAVIGSIFFVGALVVITAAFVAAVMVALCVVAVRGALHAITPAGRHRADERGFRPAAVIETTAKVIRSAAPKARS